MTVEPSRAVRRALERLRVRRLLLAIHDGCFPATERDDLGRATAGGPGGIALLREMRRLGFDGIQLGPDGLGPDDDPSPYVTSWFSRSPLAISLARLADPDDAAGGGLLDPARLAAALRARPSAPPDRIEHEAASRAHRMLVGAAYERFLRERARGEARARALGVVLDAWCEGERGWLEHDALYEALRIEHGGREWMHWSGPGADLDRVLDAPPAAGGADPARVEARRAGLLARHEPVLAFYRFTQFLVHLHHEALRAECACLGLALYGDLQVGPAPRDSWSRRHLFLDGYLMGAPPSRTNPDGQPWGYEVFDPERGAEVRAFLGARVRRLLAGLDGLRIDHPHGLVTPWVYRAGTPDPFAAVRAGARLRSSPDLPELARYAIAELDQVVPADELPRYAEAHVRALRPEQVARYSELLDGIVADARALGRAEPAVICEVLSTMPHELGGVMARHALGRFRVTQKSKLDDPDDIYRSENADPADWIMLGTHDTRPLALVIEGWRAAGELPGRAARLAALLEPDARRRETLAARLEAEPGDLAQACLAEILASPAEHVMIFFADLFGLESVYNTPGTVGPHNWRLRLTRDWRADYGRALEAGCALDLPAALALALRSKGDDGDAALVAELEAQSPRPVPRS